MQRIKHFRRSPKPAGHVSGAGKAVSPNRLATVLACALAGLGLGTFGTNAAHSAISAIGEITPAYNGSDPWGPGRNLNLTIGDSGSGTLNIENGSEVSSDKYACLGYNNSAIGTVTVTGAGSVWNSRRGMLVGLWGTGTLNVENAGVVNVLGDTWTGRWNPTAKGTINLNNGTLNTRGLLASPSELLGTGTINVDTLVSDVDLVFDATSGLQPQLLLNSLPGQNITINIDASGPSLLSSLGAGYRGVGTLTIADGVSMDTKSGYIGLHAGSNGTATVSGINSEWNIDAPFYSDRFLHIGDMGSGTLNILDGGLVSSANSDIGLGVGSTGTVTISGQGSVMENSNNLIVGNQGAGALTIENEGVSHTKYGRIGLGSGSVGIATVSGLGSRWNNSRDLTIGHNGTGILNIENDGVVNVTQDTFVGRTAMGSGTINFNNGTVNTTNLLSSPSDLRGSGTIYTAGLVSDIDLVFDANHSLQQQIVFNTLPDQDVTINLDASNPGNTSTLGAGYRGTGTLLISDGMSVASGLGYLGFNAGSTGTATIVGAGTTWNTQGLKVGLSGTGILNIENAGIVNSTYCTIAGGGGGSKGTVTVSDAILNSSVSVNGGGVLHIENEGEVNSASSGIDSGSVTVTGLGSIWNNSHGMDISGGGDSAGTLNIVNRGTVRTVGSAFIAGSYDSTGRANITGTGSTWNIIGRLSVGEQGNGTLSILNGGVANSSRGRIGSYYVDWEIPRSTAIGVATVSGRGSTWNNVDGLAVGVEGIGTLNIKNGGVVTVGANMKLGETTRSIGTVNLSGGTLDLNGSNLMHGLGTVIFNFTGGTLKNVGTIDLGQPFVQAGGTLTPGGSIGQTDIVGDYLLNAGAVEIEVGGVGNPHDLLTTTGNIDIALLDTTLGLPALGSMAAGTYTIIESTGGTITGVFESVTGIGLYAGLVDVQYTAHAVAITLNWDFVPGDLDGDGFVGIADLNLILSAWNQSVAAGDLSSGEVTGDGFVGIADLNAVLGNWNQGAPPTAESLSLIPEPASLGLLAAGMLGCSARRRFCH